MLTLEDLIGNIYIQGSCQIPGKDILSKFDFSPFDSPKRGDRTYNTALPEERFAHLTDPQADLVLDIMIELKANLFANTKMRLLFNDVWEGVGDNVVDYHNDYDPYLPDYLAHLNIYLDDSGPNSGGLLEVMAADSGDVISSFYPKKHDIVIINQKPGYLHRAHRCCTKRRLISFKVAFPEFMKRI